jgi:hypothetical protein
VKKSTAFVMQFTLHRRKRGPRHASTTVEYFAVRPA